MEPGIASACGVEIDRIKCDKAAAFLRHTVGELERRGVSSSRLEEPEIQCKAIEQVCILTPLPSSSARGDGVGGEFGGAWRRPKYSAGRLSR